jgi:hypothetical protein
MELTRNLPQSQSWLRQLSPLDWLYAVALAAGAGAALVLLRPWRLLPLTALALTAARSIPVAELLAAWLAQARRTRQAAQERPAGTATN